jgi:hypothetical protein
VFSRELDSLYVLGFVEFADAAYQRFDEMAQLVMIDVNARETGVRKDELTALNIKPAPTGRPARRSWPTSTARRHANYVERTKRTWAYHADFPRPVRLARRRPPHVREAWRVAADRGAMPAEESRRAGGIPQSKEPDPCLTARRWRSSPARPAGSAAR